jgi:hypothetical protein
LPAAGQGLRFDASQKTPLPTAGIVGRQRMRFGFIREICQRST